MDSWVEPKKEKGTGKPGVDNRSILGHFAKRLIRKQVFYIVLLMLVIKQETRKGIESCTVLRSIQNLDFNASVPLWKMDSGRHLEKRILEAFLLDNIRSKKPMKG